MNSTMEALYFGVPLVTFPRQPEQEATARRVEELGLGRRLALPTVDAVSSIIALAASSLPSLSMRSWH
jgi:UDP:flavonoid glycosyltransferase YjiC (YdhE family)